ncbi:hypothetical protein N9B92_01005 [Porticoccaceae bacterium]|nr:hypothetical protein [Porticoccaceae bacterium]
MSRNIPSTDANWEDGTLGASLEHAEISPNRPEDIDDALAMQSISIRLSRSLIDDLKILAEINGLGYQPLIRRVLTRFVAGETKQLLKDNASLLRKQGIKTSDHTQGDKKRA